MTSVRPDGDRYEITDAERESFERDGYVRLPGFLNQTELAELERVYMKLLRRDIPVTGRDFCDMSGDYEKPVEEYALLNVMLPRRYHTPWRNNIYERRAQSVARQLHGDDMELDYDQIVAKPPGKQNAVFHWHQDQAYWPNTPDQRTASFWLAFDECNLENGCVRFVVGSHREKDLRPHLPLLGDRNKSHTLVARVDEAREDIRPALLSRGDVTVHHERAVHGSGGNTSTRWRRGYVVAFRSRDTIARERAVGFTHSHNDDPRVLEGIAKRRL